MALPFGNPFAKKIENPPPKQGEPQLGKDGSGVIPGNDTPKGAGASDDPMADFEKLWQPNVGADGKPVVTNTGPKSYMPKIDPAAMNAMIGKIDFTKDFAPEEMAAITKGGDEAAAAFASMINKASRRAFSTAFAGANKMSEAALQSMRDDVRSEIPDHVKDMMIDSSLETSNPFMKDPMFKPLVDTVKAQFRAKYPKASPAEIQQGVNKYFDTMYEKGHSVKNPKKEITNKDKLSQGGTDADWLEWAGNELPSGDSTQNGGNDEGIVL